MNFTINLRMSNHGSLTKENMGQLGTHLRIAKVFLEVELCLFDLKSEVHKSDFSR